MSMGMVFEFFTGNHRVYPRHKNGGLLVRPPFLKSMKLINQSKNDQIAATIA